MRKDVKTKVSNDLNFTHHKVPGLVLLVGDYDFIMKFLSLSVGEAIEALNHF